MGEYVVNFEGESWPIRANSWYHAMRSFGRLHNLEWRSIDGLFDPKSKTAVYEINPDGEISRYLSIQKVD
jgi:hypothetical protein